MATISQISRNQKWVASAHFGRRPSRLGHLYDALVAGVFPLLQSARFVRVDVAPKGFAEWTGEDRIVFQRREGTEWPTIEFEMARRGPGYCKVHLGVLPPECWALSGERVPQDEAAVWMSPAYLMLSRNAKSGPHCQEFGVRRLLLFERRVIRKDIIALRRLLQVAFQHFHDGFPGAWREARSPAVHRNLSMVWGPWNPGRVNRSAPSGEYYRSVA